MKEEIELYLPKDHNVAQDIIIPPGVDPGKRYRKKQPNCGRHLCSQHGSRATRAWHHHVPLLFQNYTVHPTPLTKQRIRAYDAAGTVTSSGNFVPPFP